MTQNVGILDMEAVEMMTNAAALHASNLLQLAWEPRCCESYRHRNLHHEFEDRQSNNCTIKGIPVSVRPAEEASQALSLDCNPKISGESQDRSNIDLTVEIQENTCRISSRSLCSEVF